VTDDITIPQSGGEGIPTIPTTMRDNQNPSTMMKNQTTSPTLEGNHSTPSVMMGNLTTPSTMIEHQTTTSFMMEKQITHSVMVENQTTSPSMMDTQTTHSVTVRNQVQHSVGLENLTTPSSMMEQQNTFAKQSSPMIIMEEYEAAMEVTAKLELKEALENRRRRMLLKRRLKKDPLEPKRALSAYNIFVKEKYQRLRESKQLDKPDHTLFSYLGVEWNSLDDQEKLIYHSKAQLDKNRSHAEWEKYRTGVKSADDPQSADQYRVTPSTSSTTSADQYRVTPSTTSATSAESEQKVLPFFQH